VSSFGSIPYPAQDMTNISAFPVPAQECEQQQEQLRHKTVIRLKTEINISALPAPAQDCGRIGSSSISIP
jgi:hypothetical protein